MIRETEDRIAVRSTSTLWGKGSNYKMQPLKHHQEGKGLIPLTHRQ